MEILEILKNSIKYPFSDIQTFLIIGVIFLAIALFNSLGTFFESDTLGIVGSIVGLILTVFIAGYQLDVLKFGMDLKDELPSVDIEKNLKNGVKLIVVNIVYYIIPIIVAVLLTFILGTVVYSNIHNAHLTLNSTETQFLNAFASPSTVGSVILVFIILFIVFVLFSLLALMAQSRLAKSGELNDALSFGKSYSDLKEIGIGKTLALIILLYIVIFVILIIFGLISAIPYIGLIVSSLVGTTFISFMTYRAYGLLYSEIA